MSLVMHLVASPFPNPVMHVVTTPIAWSCTAGDITTSLLLSGGITISLCGGSTNIHHRTALGAGHQVLCVECWSCVCFQMNLKEATGPKSHQPHGDCSSSNSSLCCSSSISHSSLCCSSSISNSSLCCSSSISNSRLCCSSSIIMTCCSSSTNSSG